MDKPRRTLADVIGRLKPLPQWVEQPELLLHPQIPKPMHGLAPRVVFGANWWNKEREKAYRSTNYHCQACGVEKGSAKSRQWLEAHEVYDIDYAAGRMVYVRSVPLCHYCHAFIHDGRLAWLLETGRLHQSKYVAIMQHGDAVLAEAGLRKPSRIEREGHLTYLLVNGGIARWGEWRLVIEGIEYPSLYESQEAYDNANRNIWEDE